MLVRYIRESYLGRNDNYSRLTFDRSLCYRPARDWTLLPAGGSWWSMDSGMAFNRTYGGVILELGSRLSHGAVVAREYQVPAVVNLDGVMRRLVDGQIVTVDGTRGLVWVQE